MINRARTTFALAVLFAINAMNFFDRQILGAIAEPIRREWGLSDTELGNLGTAFTLLYAVVGVPLGRMTDKGNRRKILAGGVFVWSLFTALSGLARGYWTLFAFRLGVGVGEATCAPASSSLIGDLFPATRRGRALSIFMMGLPIGIALSYAVSGTLARSYGWRSAFYVAGIPGLICAAAALFISEPARGGAETHGIGSQKREGSPYWLVLSIPTMWWIILSGAFHNFNMYAIASFLSPFLQRSHGVDVRTAGFISMAVYGLSGVPGLLLGGIAGDAVMKKRLNGRLLVGTIGILISVPCVFFALQAPRGSVVAFTLLMGVGCGVMYSYYSTVYSTIQDVIEPSLRGTAMALYFFAMYVLGASLGPAGMGFLSDHFTQKAAVAAGVTDFSFQALEPFRAEGLHTALYIIPALGVLLTLVLFAGSRTVKKDIEKLQRWMSESTGSPSKAAAVRGA